MRPWTNLRASLTLAVTLTLTRVVAILTPSSPPSPVPFPSSSPPPPPPSPPLAFGRYGFDDGRGHGFDPASYEGDARYDSDEQYSDDEMFGQPPGMYARGGDRGGDRRRPKSQGRATPEQRGDAQGRQGGGYDGRSVWTHAEDTIILDGVAQVGRPRAAPLLAPPARCTASHRLHRLHRLHRW